MCQSSNNIQVNIFSETNYNPVQHVKREEDSNFDSVLKNKWEEAQKNRIFRYVLDIRDSKILDGRYQFIVQVI